jgi:hypothetical protein
MPLGGQCLVRVHRETDFAARGDQNHFGIPAGGASARTYAPRDTPDAAAYFVRSKVGKGWRDSTSTAGFMPKLQNVAIRLDHFVGVGGPQRHKSRESRASIARCSTG